MKRIVNTVEENPKREKIMKVWKDHTTEDVITAVEKNMTAISPKQSIPATENCAQMCMNSQDL